MNVNLTFPADVESALQRSARAAGLDVATFVQFAVAEKLAEAETPQPAGKRSPAEFHQRLHAWINLHPVLEHAIDDSRESLYAGRGE